MRNREGVNNPCYRHGFAGKHPLYNTWRNIKSRCLYKKNRYYKNYGGRGIKICDEWKNKFMVFYNWSINNGWEESLSIDRIDNNSGYYPYNCRFTTRIIQGRNQRTRGNSISKYKGITFNKESKKWRARIHVDKKAIFLGRFITKEQAYLERQKYIKENNLTDFI